MRFCEVLRGSRFYEVLSHQLGVASAERAHLGTLVGRAVVGRIFVVAAVVAVVLVLRLELGPLLPEVVPVLEEAVGVASVELVPVPGWSKAARSATSEVARLSSLGRGWELTGLASSWDCRAAQSHQAGTLTMLRYRAASSSYRCTQ